MPEASQQAVSCPECGASLSPGHPVCWLCNRKTGDANINPYSPPRPIADTSGDLQFSLTTLFLITTLAAVCLGVFALSPGLGIVVSMVAVPALVRTMIATQYRKKTGERPALSVKILEFVISAATVTAAAIAGMIAFAAVCTTATLGSWSISQGNGALVIGVTAGAIAGFALLVWLLWRTRPPHW